ncbi:MAG: DUF2490 domain-containing protein [Cytophagaceae bacterium]
MKIIYSLLAVLHFTFNSEAQTVTKHVHTREQLWLGYLNQSRFSNKVGSWVEVQHRMSDNFTDRNFLSMFRGAITYYFRDNLRLHIGYAYVHHYPATGLSTARPEHRPWQQIFFTNKYNGYTTLQWLRLEQRFVRKVAADVLQDDYRFNFRLRYNFSLFIPLKGKEMKEKTPFFAIIDEVFINFGKEITYNYFDQNRFFIGFGYQFSSQLNAQLGYMNVYQQEAAGNRFVDNHCIRLFVFHNFDLRKKE